MLLVRDQNLMVSHTLEKAEKKI